MAAEHGGEASQSHEAGYSPHGAAGQRVGELACILRVRLMAPGEELAYDPGKTPRWTDDDRLAFGYLLDFDDSLPMLAREARERDIDQPFPAIDRFLFMSPLLNGGFDWPAATHRKGAWWDWIKDARDAAWGLNIAQAYELVKRGGSFPYDEQLMRIFVPGVRGNYTDGALIAHQWTTWRRGLAPYDGPYSVDAAHEALDEIAGELVPNGPRRHVVN